MVLALCTGFTALAAEARKERPEERLPARYREWLLKVDLLITAEERRVFLGIERDYHRDAFIERFWRVRDPWEDTTRNELRERWEARAAEAKMLFRSLDDDRARILLLNGPPVSRCRDLRAPREVWHYQGSERTRAQVYLIFVRRSANGGYRLWVPGLDLGEGPGAPPGAGPRAASAAPLCPLGIVDRLVRGMSSGVTMEYLSVLSEIQRRPEPPSSEWVFTFEAYSTDLPSGAPTFEAAVDLEFPGRYQSRTVVQALVTVPLDAVVRGDMIDHHSYNFLLIGEVVREDRLFENFRYRFDLPVDLLQEPQIPLVFQRFLRPGRYILVVKLEDLNGGRFFRNEVEISVPRVQGLRAYLPPTAASLEILDEANAAITSGETAVKIIPPAGELHIGMMRIDARVTGPGVDEVAFYLDEKPILSKRRPPFSVELDLGDLPRVRAVRVVARAVDGEELATDELLLNASSNRFAVELVEPRPGRRYQRSLQASARVSVPEGRVVQRVEFYLDEDHMATLFQEPFVQPIVLPAGAPVTYVRAVAYLPDGNSTEDVVFINAPDYLEEIDIRMVELYTSVFNKSGRPVDGLSPADFRIFEDGVEQEIVRFERVRDLPIHAGILLDSSASMHDRMDRAKSAAVKFFEQTITPKDRAVVIPFHDQPYVAVRFSNQIGDLAEGLVGVKAERGTALYDSIIYALHYFNGIKGQRAILLLSDGKDEHSRFEFDDALEFARRAGVTIYSIGLDLHHGASRARRELGKLAEQTGGRSFFIRRIEELDTIYSDLEEELRSQYLIAYQSSNSGDSEEFRTVEVKVEQGLEAKTLRGYYP